MCGARAEQTTAPRGCSVPGAGQVLTPTLGDTLATLVISQAKDEEHA